LGVGGGQRGFFLIDQDLVRLLVELDEQVPLVYAVVVIDEDLHHLTGHARRYEGHVAVDVGVVGGNRVQRQHQPGNREPRRDRQGDRGPRKQQQIAQQVGRR